MTMIMVKKRSLPLAISANLTHQSSTVHLHEGEEHEHEDDHAEEDEHHDDELAEQVHL